MDTIEIHMNERKTVLAKIAKDALDNELLDNNSIIKMYEDFSKECDVYKYVGTKDALVTALENEVVTNALGHKAFLETLAKPEYGITVLDFIKMTL